MSIRSLALAVLICFALPTGSAFAQGTDPALDPEEHNFCTQINLYRAMHGIPPLKVSISLTNASRWMSADMASNDYFDHTDSLGRSFSSRIWAFGYDSSYVAENIAAGTPGGIATFNLWRSSAPHNLNMLSTSYKSIGIGRAYDEGSPYGWYWTTDFGNISDHTIAC